MFFLSPCKNVLSKTKQKRLLFSFFFIYLFFTWSVLLDALCGFSLLLNLKPTVGWLHVVSFMLKEIGPNVVFNSVVSFCGTLKLDLNVFPLIMSHLRANNEDEQVFKCAYYMVPVFLNWLIFSTLNDHYCQCKLCVITHELM